MIPERAKPLRKVQCPICNLTTPSVRSKILSIQNKLCKLNNPSWRTGFYKFINMPEFFSTSFQSFISDKFKHIQVNCSHQQLRQRLLDKTHLNAKELDFGLCILSSSKARVQAVTGFLLSQQKLQGDAHLEARQYINQQIKEFETLKETEQISEVRVPGLVKELPIKEQHIEEEMTEEFIELKKQQWMEKLSAHKLSIKARDPLEPYFIPQSQDISQQINFHVKQPTEELLKILECQLSKSHLR